MHEKKSEDTEDIMFACDPGSCGCGKDEAHDPRVGTGNYTLPLEDGGVPVRVRITHIDEPDHFYDGFDGMTGELAGLATFKGTRYFIVTLDDPTYGELLLKQGEYEVIDD